MELFQSLFGPLSSNWCVIFLVISVVYFFLTIFATISFLYSFSLKIKDRGIVTLGLLMIVFNMIVIYVIARLLHGMCIKSLESKK